MNGMCGIKMKTNDIKKGMRIKSGQLGVLVTGIMRDNTRGNNRFVDVKGSEVGLFDEMGSVYSHDIIFVEVDDEWVRVEHTDKQLKLKKAIEELGF